MHMQVFKKGALYSADCHKCGLTHYTHEWLHVDHNYRRDAMQSGTLRCDECGAPMDPDTFIDCGKQYAARYAAPGYLDHTDALYGRNLRKLKRELRDLYGE